MYKALKFTVYFSYSNQTIWAEFKDMCVLISFCNQISQSVSCVIQYISVSECYVTSLHYVGSSYNLEKFFLTKVLYKNKQTHKQ